MSDHGIKISKSGFDVKTCDDDDLIFSSKFNTFRVFAYGTGNFTVPNPRVATTVNITHNIGYRSAFSFYTQIYDGGAGAVTASYSLAPYTDPIGGDASIMPYCETNHLHIRYGADQAPSGTTINFRYFIYFDQAR